jgi:hypothetical protein
MMLSYTIRDASSSIFTGSAAALQCQQRLNELEQDRARGGSSAELEYWCEIGRALLEILRATREVGEASH